MTASDPIKKRPLEGRRIAVLEHRELDRLGGMLEAQGALTLRCPLVAIADAPDATPVLAWLRRFLDAPPDDLVLMTGEGLRRLHGFADRAGLDFLSRNKRFRREIRELPARPQQPALLGIPRHR